MPIVVYLSDMNSSAASNNCEKKRITHIVTILVGITVLIALIIVIGIIVAFQLPRKNQNYFSETSTLAASDSLRRTVIALNVVQPKHIRNKRFASQTYSSRRYIIEIIRLLLLKYTNTSDLFAFELYSIQKNTTITAFCDAKCSINLLNHIELISYPFNSTNQTNAILYYYHQKIADSQMSFIIFVAELDAYSDRDEFEKDMKGSEIVLEDTHLYSSAIVVLTNTDAEAFIEKGLMIDSSNASEAANMINFKLKQQHFGRSGANITEETLPVKKIDQTLLVVKNEQPIVKITPELETASKIPTATSSESNMITTTIDMLPKFEQSSEIITNTHWIKATYPKIDQFSSAEVGERDGQLTKEPRSQTIYSKLLEATITNSKGSEEENNWRGVTEESKLNALLIPTTIYPNITSISELGIKFSSVKPFSLHEQLTERSEQRPMNSEQVPEIRSSSEGYVYIGTTENSERATTSPMLRTVMTNNSGESLNETRGFVNKDFGGTTYSALSVENVTQASRDLTITKIPSLERFSNDKSVMKYISGTVAGSYTSTPINILRNFSRSIDDFAYDLEIPDPLVTKKLGASKLQNMDIAGITTSSNPSYSASNSAEEKFMSSTSPTSSEKEMSLSTTEHKLDVLMYPRKPEFKRINNDDFSATSASGNISLAPWFILSNSKAPFVHTYAPNARFVDEVEFMPTSAPSSPLFYSTSQSSETGEEITSNALLLVNAVVVHRNNNSSTNVSSNTDEEGIYSAEIPDSLMHDSDYDDFYNH